LQIFLEFYIIFGLEFLSNLDKKLCYNSLMSTAIPSYIDTELHYSCVGTGPDILLVHGWMSSGRMWSGLTHALADHARCWSVDLCGFGDSPLPNADGFVPDLEHHAAMLIEFCSAHGIHPQAIIGHSMGGMLALKLAVMRPDLMDQLVLMAPVVSGRFGKFIELNRIITSDIGQAAMAYSKPIWSLFQSDIMDVFTPTLMTPWFTHAEAAARIRQDFKRTSWQAAAYAIESIARENMEPYLEQITQPALVIIGSRDATVPPREGRMASQRLPNGQLLELPAIYHQPLDECPDKVIPAVRDFLSSI
jgi:pimeloyl-ACP methyl ester carboxylesterase